MANSHASDSKTYLLEPPLGERACHVKSRQEQRAESMQVREALNQSGARRPPKITPRRSDVEQSKHVPRKAESGPQAFL